MFGDIHSEKEGPQPYKAHGSPDLVNMHTTDSLVII